MPQSNPQRALVHLKKKICSAKRLARIVRGLKRAGRRVVFTNGCFDVLHVGHVTLLGHAKRLGDVLIVGINSDRSVRALKGRGRPLVSQPERALLLAALESVDYVTVFDASTPRNLVARLRPDVLVKGADWNAKDIVGRDIVEHNGGRVVRVPLITGHSTSRLIKRMRKWR